MGGKKNNQNAKDDKLGMNEDVNVKDTEVPADAEGTCASGDAGECGAKAAADLQAELDDKTKKCDEYLEKLQRLAAEFDNFKKRTAREKEALYSDAVCDVTSEILPVLDNLERALQACSKENDLQALKDGVELVFRQMKGALKKIGVEEIDCVDSGFDPQLHNAVMHVEDEELGQNVVVEEFQKGYCYKDKVIRHSMVKVAN